MALAAPYVGYLLSKYKETILEGLGKIHQDAKIDSVFGVSFLSDHQAVGALKQLLLRRRDLGVNAVETLCSLLESCEVVLSSTSPSGKTVGSPSAVRSSVLRELLQENTLFVFKNALSSTSDNDLPMTVASLRLLCFAAQYVPKVLLARFQNTVPLHLACFRSPLPYTQRRLRLYRSQFLLQLATSRYLDTAQVIMASHGFLTHLVEDAAELLVEGSTQGGEIGRNVLKLLHSFIQHRAVSASEKRALLLSQRSVLRLLVKAIDYPPVVDEVMQTLSFMVKELVESPSDYPRHRLEALTTSNAEGEDRGMPNYLLFLLLRQLRPRKGSKVVELVMHILYLAPDLIRPYFSRFSQHLVEDVHHQSRQGRNRGETGIALPTAKIALMNLMTRIFLAPLPYHLSHHLASLHFSRVPSQDHLLSRSSFDAPGGVGERHLRADAGDGLSLASRTEHPEMFYQLTPKDVVQEVCPSWIGEFIHQMINGSTDLLFLLLAMQLAQSALYRAAAVLEAVRAISIRMIRTASLSTSAACASNCRSHPMDSAPPHAQHPIFHEGDVQELWGAFEAEVESGLLSVLPKREEFLHRLTQQLHPMLMADHTSAPTTKEGEISEKNEVATSSLPKVEFIMQRMLLLFHSYTTVFRLRVSWMSVIPHQLPPVSSLKQLRVQRLRDCAMQNGKRSTAGSQSAMENDGSTYISSVLRSDADYVLQWSPTTISALCSLLCESMARGVSMNKLHHINLSSAPGAISNHLSEWPLLLRLLAWSCRHRDVVLEGGKEKEVETRTDSLSHSSSQSEYRRSVYLATSWVARLVQWTVHGLTVSLSCTWEEVFLWMEMLPFETLPCFLHALNHLLQRSLSKAADRVTAELLRAENGVLVMAAENFIGSQRGKEGRISQSGAENSSPNVSVADPWMEDLMYHLPVFERVVHKIRKRWARRLEISQRYIRSLQFNPRYVPHIKKLGAPRTVTAMTSSGASFAVSPVCPSAIEQWMSFRSSLKTPLPSNSIEESELRERLWSTVSSPFPEVGSGAFISKKNHLELKSESEAGYSSEKIHGSILAHHSWMSLLVQALGVLQSSISCTDNALKVEECSPAKAGVPSSTVKSPILWYQMGAVCWDIARHVLLAYLGFTSASSNSLNADNFPASLRTWLDQFLYHVADQEEAITRSLCDGKDDTVVGFNFLLLACLHLLLVEKKKKEEKHQWKKSASSSCFRSNSSKEGDLEEEAQIICEMKAMGEREEKNNIFFVLARIETIFCQQYHGTVGIVDRIRYAALLTIHYLLYDADKRSSEGDTESKCTAKQEIKKMEPEENKDGIRREQVLMGGPSRKEYTFSHHPYVFTGASLPRAFHSHRFLIWNHVSPPNITPEVDVLLFITSMWTDQELVLMALEMPARLHNTLLCGTWTSGSSLRRMASPSEAEEEVSPCCPPCKRTRREGEGTEEVKEERRSVELIKESFQDYPVSLLQPDPLYDLTRAIFPEVTAETDLTELLITNTVSCLTTILDPRYLLPLLQTVCSLPKKALSLSQRLNIGTRCFPYLLRSLSFTDPSLRLCAMAALSAMVLPAGPLKVIDTFARLKLMQRAQKDQCRRERSNARGRGSSEYQSLMEKASTVLSPRLPAPLSAFLVLSIRAMGRYDDPLHHHLSHFFLETQESFGVAVPFAHWLISYPLDAISHPLMVRQQEKAMLQKHTPGSRRGTNLSGGGGSIFGGRVLDDGSTFGLQAVSSSSSGGGGSYDTALATIAHFKKTTPPQLRFILRVVSFGCQTKGDAVALLESDCLQGIMLLCDMLTSSNELRHELVQCLTQICFSQSSSAVGVYLAQEGHLLSWIFQFLVQLCREYGASVPHLYAEPLFYSSMALATRLSRIVFQHGDRQALFKVIYPFIRNHIQLLRRHLTEARVTAKQILELMGNLEFLWKGQGKGVFRREE